MATLSPFIKTVPSSSSTSMITNHSGTITKTSPSGCLSLLSSDIEEDLGILDLNAREFNYICRQEYWLLNDDEYNPETNFSYDIVLEWIDGYTPMKSDEDYKKFFHVTNNDNNHHRFQHNLSINGHNSHRNHLTPINGYNRFDYLTKSSAISRTATITKRKIENINNNNDNQLNTPTDSSSMNTTVRYGTITKGMIARPFLTNNNHTREINRTFDIFESKVEFNESPTISSSDDNEQISTLNINTPSNNHNPINTNTITRTKSSQCDLSNLSTSETDHGSDSNQVNNLMTTSDDVVEEFGLSSDSGLTDNNDLKRPSLKSQTLDASDRNYPTISRNTSSTLFLRREASQGQINNNRINNINNRTISRTPQPMKQVYLVSSNDDLLSSDCSTLSLRSSTMSGGRSEPNLLDAQKRTTNGSAQLSIHNKNQQQQPKPRLSQIQVIQAPKFQSRLMGPTGIAVPATNGNRISRIALPSTNGVSSQPSLVNIRSSGIPGNKTTSIRSTNSFGSMGSIRDQQLRQNHPSQQQSNQFQMPRAVSQIEMNNDDDGQQQDFNGNNVQQQRFGMGLDRKSTFRVTNRTSSSPSSSSTLMAMTTMLDGQQYLNQKPVMNNQQTNDHFYISNWNGNHHTSNGSRKQQEVDDVIAIQSMPYLSSNNNNNHRSSSPSSLSRNKKLPHSKQSSIVATKSAIAYRSLMPNECSNHNDDNITSICSDHTNNNNISNAAAKSIVLSSRIPGLMNNRLSIPVYGNNKGQLQRPNLINNYEQMPNQIKDSRMLNNCMESAPHVMVMPVVNIDKSTNLCRQQQQQQQQQHQQQQKQLNRTIITATAHHQPSRGFKINSCDGYEDNSWQDDCY
ncbi:hypothetical protein DERF_007631 [Dermatophagoides farinae]|uniref:Uncharacterized protein n=1 Tax=Dermatophagoides farinae TaxID=6954 RepID=A0A922HZC9_DERFA|nr:hypothetical protein DERF_007631 [Dermatophagoides farinae]